jgi:hypothetical protein
MQWGLLQGCWLVANEVWLISSDGDRVSVRMVKVINEVASLIVSRAVHL